MSPLSLALSNLTQQPRRTLVSVIGVAFAVLLLFMQLGFYDAVTRTATLLYERLAFDLLLVSPEYISLAKPSTFPRRRIAQAAAVEGVASARPITVMLGQWRSMEAATVEGRPDEDAARLRWTIMVLAVQPYRLDELFRNPVGTVFRTRAEMVRETQLLARMETVLIDRTSRSEYGDAKTWRPGTLNELSGRRVEIVGDVKIGTGFAYNGLLVTSESTVSRLLGWPDDLVSFGLIRLADGPPDQARLRQVQEELRRALPEDVRVYTRAEIDDQEKNFWLTKTAVGQFFFAGVVIAMLVGAVFVYQMMSADISRRLSEYATIRALGYPGGYLTRVVYWQGFLLALAGYAPGLVTAMLCYLAAEWRANIPLVMTAPRLALVLVLAVVMCMFSAVAASRAVYRANPADLF